jgi:hypothetical protein
MTVNARCDSKIPRQRRFKGSWFLYLPRQTVVLTALSLTIAILTSPGTFYQRGASWKNPMQAATAIQVRASR